MCKNHLMSLWYRNRTEIDAVEDMKSWQLDSEEKLLLQEVMLLPEKHRISIYLHYFK